MAELALLVSCLTFVYIGVLGLVMERRYRHNKINIRHKSGTIYNRLEKKC